MYRCTDARHTSHKEIRPHTRTHTLPCKHRRGLSIRYTSDFDNDCDELRAKRSVQRRPDRVHFGTLKELSRSSALHAARIFFGTTLYRRWRASEGPAMNLSTRFERERKNWLAVRISCMPHLSHHILNTA